MLMWNLQQSQMCKFHSIFVVNFNLYSVTNGKVNIANDVVEVFIFITLKYRNLIPIKYEEKRRGDHSKIILKYVVNFYFLYKYS